MMKKEAFILPGAEIDMARWDACIAANSNGLVYATSDYLNTMTDHWHGIVIDDYSAVMPIPWRMKFGIRYAYIPSFTQQLGLVGTYDEADMQAILRTLPDFVRYADIHFNFANTPVNNHGINCIIHQRTNLVLDLRQTADDIQHAYKDNLKQSLQQAARANLQYREETDTETPIILFRSLYGDKLKHTRPADYKHLATLCKKWQQQHRCFARNVYTSSGILLASALFLKDGKRIYNLINAILPEGRKQMANHWLLHNVLMEFAGQSLLFDFEGSELPGVKEFFMSFSPKEEEYRYYQYNGLPWWVRWVKDTAH